jgi:hypothetical protein
MNTLYQTMLAGFRESLAQLSPQKAYSHLRDIASTLVRAGFTQRNTAIENRNVLSGTRHLRNRNLLIQLAKAYDAYARKELAEAKRVAEKLITDSDSVLDPWSAVDAEHLLGRIQFDEQRFPEAEEDFLRIMDHAQRLTYEEGFIRAVHEISRVQHRKSEIIDAEAGFRVALDYYSLRALRRNVASSDLSPDGQDLKNIQAALNCLGGVAETYFLLSRGPTEAVHLIDALGSDSFNSRDDSGYDFLEIRGLALNLLTRSELAPHTADLVGKAMKLYADQRALAIYALEEAAWTGDQRGITYPSKLKVILTQPDPFPLRNVPSFKPDISSLESRQPGLRYNSPASAAESIEQLYDYLTTLDRDGRYVYRGQIREYEGPLLPSAFRSILREPYPLKTLPLISIDSRKRLRHCGETFVGEYNNCFGYYADVMKKHREDGMQQAEIERIFGVYKRLLDDPFIALEQAQETFVPWQRAVQRCLPEADFDIYLSNATQWNVRVDNYHKRLLRDNVLVRLFGYALGTTFAQQYGLASEGLDATKSLGVACFFATHDPSDFLRVADEGIGILYRFAFPANDIATKPLSAFSYYNLPSIVDVEDVFYRFEHSCLSKSDSIACMLCYLTSVLTYGMDPQSSDMILLPEGFLHASRVHAQEAAIVVPDEIREDEPNRTPGPGGITFPKYRYIEDLASRPGVARFYFKHTGTWPEKLSSIRRERLWPRDDFLLETLVLLIASSYRLSQAIPKRLDLIDGGYHPADFFSYCQELYDQYRYRFVTGDEAVASRKFFNLIL